MVAAPVPGLGKNQWEVAFRDSAQTRKFMEADYAQMKRVMTSLGIVK